MATKCWKCKLPLDETPFEMIDFEYYTNRGGGGRGFVKFVILIFIICIILFSLIWILYPKDQEDGNTIVYDSAFDFMNDWHVVGDKLNYSRASIGDTIEFNDTISYMEYDSNEDTTYLKFASFFTKEAKQQGYQNVKMAFNGDLRNSVSVSDEVCVRFKIISYEGHEIWDHDKYSIECI